MVTWWWYTMVKAKKHIAGSWFQPHWNVFIEFDNFPEDQGKKKESLKNHLQYRQIDEWILQTWWALQ